MSDQSLDGLLQRLQGKSITLGWDAVVTMNRTKVNQLLLQQYIEQFNQDSFLKRIHGAVKVDDSTLELTGLLLSQPRLSFVTASLESSRARLTMDIVSGMVTTTVKTAGSPSRIASSFAVTEQHQRTLTMDIELEAVNGSVGVNGEVVLDLAKAVNFSCNLVENINFQLELGLFFHRLFNRLPASSRVYRLGMLDFDPDDKLAPRNFIVRTQAAPGARTPGASNYEDGAVVLFVRTRQSDMDGDYPGEEGGFPYLIPDDQVDGKHIYSGSLILDSRVLFDWFLHPWLQGNIGERLALDHVVDAEDLPRHLRAIGGAWISRDIDGFLPVPPGSWKVSNAEPLAFDFASAEAGSSAFEVKVGAGGVLTLEWKGSNTFEFFFKYSEINGPSREEHARVTFTHHLMFQMKPVVDPATSRVTFETMPGGISEGAVKKISGDLELNSAVGGLLASECRRMLTAMHDKIKAMQLPELDLFAINHLLFPEKNALLLTHGAVPGDLALFGHIDPKQTTFTIEPAIIHIEAGTQHRFELTELFKAKAGNVTWSVRGIDGSRSQGEIDQSGQYVAPTAERMEGLAVRNIVTATLKDPDSGEEYTASAMVVVALHSLVVTPSMATIDLSKPEPLTLDAAALKGGALTWSVRNGLGSLEVDGNRAIYTPPATLEKPIDAALVEVTEVSSGNSVLATILLIKSYFLLELLPALHPGVPPGGSARVRTSDPTYPADELVWSVVIGEGSIDPATGVFTAPETIKQPYSVVQVKYEDRQTLYGYSIIFQSEYATEAKWNELDKFELRHDLSLQLFSNGLQQLSVTVEALPLAVDFEEVSISDSELESIVLVDANTLEELPRVDQEGVPEGEGWAYNLLPNGYVMHPGTQAVDPDESRQSRYKKLYVQTRASTRLKIAALLIRDDRLPFYSNHGSSAPPYIIEPVPVRPPSFSDENYTFEVTRVIGEEDNDYHLETVDYYILQLTHGAELIRFHSIEFEQRSSMVQWESRQVQEEVASFTGYAFYDDSELRFDAGMFEYIPEAARPDLNVVPAHQCPKGALLISLHRCQYWFFDTACEGSFAKAMVLRVTDEFGNLHRLRVNFASPTDRNTLVVSVL